MLFHPKHRPVDWKVGEPNMKRLPWIYLAGPYTAPDPCENTHLACYLWRRLFSRYRGVAVVICPHWSHFQHTMHPMPYEHWLDYGLDKIRLLSASPGVVFRMMGKSPGADEEVDLAKQLGIPVVRTERELARVIEGMV